MLAVEISDRSVSFSVKVMPRSSRNAIAGLYGHSLKIKLTAPPTGGAANRMCVAFLAGLLEVSKSDIEIVTGKTARHKTIRIQRPSPTAAKVTAKHLIRLAESASSPEN